MARLQIFRRDSNADHEQPVLDHQASAVSDATEESAGWYWQFNQSRIQSADIDTTWTIPASTSPPTDRINPCTIELGSGWRIPTFTEWDNDESGGWSN
jgi:hypothetical protein